MLNYKLVLDTLKEIDTECMRAGEKVSRAINLAEALFAAVSDIEPESSETTALKKSLDKLQRCIKKVSSTLLEVGDVVREINQSLKRFEQES